MFDSGCGAVGSALVWGTRGHRFKSGHPDQNIHPENQVLIHCDCLTELKEMKEESAELVYPDPPFFTQKKQSLKTKDNSREYSFEDAWESIDGFLKIDGEMRPVPVRIQRTHETIEDAGNHLLNASKRNGYETKILVKTSDEKAVLPFDLQNSNSKSGVVIIENIKDFQDNKWRYIATL